MIAIASQNGSIYLFRVSRDGFSYKKSNKIRGSQPLIQMDWSSDSNFLQTVTADFDLCFCKCYSWFLRNNFFSFAIFRGCEIAVSWEESNSYERCEVVHTELNCRILSCRYVTVTLPYLSLTVFIFRDLEQSLLPYDINNKYRESISCTWLADFRRHGRLHQTLQVQRTTLCGHLGRWRCCFRYPCLSPKAEYNEEKVYSGTVACARFLFNDRNLVTVGGTDAALMLWELTEE